MYPKGVVLLELDLSSVLQWFGENRSQLPFPSLQRLCTMDLSVCLSVCVYKLYLLGLELLLLLLFFFFLVFENFIFSNEHQHRSAMTEITHFLLILNHYVQIPEGGEDKLFKNNCLCY